MTAPYTFTDESGDLLHVSACRTGLHLVAEIVADEDEPSFRAPLCVPPADVRKVTAAMHEKAGLPDRWAELRAWVGAGHESWCADVLARMDELEAGQ